MRVSGNYFFLNTIYRARHLLSPSSKLQPVTKALNWLLTCFRRKCGHWVRYRDNVVLNIHRNRTVTAIQIVYSTSSVIVLHNFPHQCRNVHKIVIIAIGQVRLNQLGSAHERDFVSPDSHACHPHQVTQMALNVTM